MRYQKRKRRPAVVFLVIVLVVIAAVGCVKLLQYAKLKMEYASYPRTYSELVNKEAEQAGVDPNLVYAVIRQESGFDANAVSHAGAIGLMQIMPDTFSWLQTKMDAQDHREYTEQDLYDPETNIRFGCKLLSILTGRYENLKTALAAYNAGMGNVDQWLKNSAYSKDGKALSEIPIGETRTYAEKVLQNYAKYQTLYNASDVSSS